MQESTRLRTISCILLGVCCDPQILKDEIMSIFILKAVTTEYLVK